MDRYYAGDSIAEALRITGIRRELVRREDIKILRAQDGEEPVPLVDELNVDNNLVPFCVWDSSRKVSKNRTDAIVGTNIGSAQPNLVRARVLDSRNAKPFSYSSRLQELTEVLTLVDAGLHAIDSHSKSPPWLQSVTRTVEMMHVVRTNAIPDCILNVIYLPLVSVVMHKYIKFDSPGVTFQQSTVQIPSAKSLLILFNRSGLALEKGKQGLGLVHVGLGHDSPIVEDSPQLCTQRHLAIRTFLERMNDPCWEGIGSDIELSTCEVVGDSCTIRLCSDTSLQCVVIPAFALPEALALARKPKENDVCAQIKASVLRKHMHNLDALFGSNLNKHDTEQESTRESDAALMTHVNLRFKNDPSATLWNQLTPSDEELKRSVLLKRLSDVKVDKGSVGGGYRSWDVYHPALALRALVLGTSFEEAARMDECAEQAISVPPTPLSANADEADVTEKTENNVSPPKTHDDTDESDDEENIENDNSGGESGDDEKEDSHSELLPGIDPMYYMCPKGECMKYYYTTPSEYNGAALCDECGFNFDDKLDHNNPIYHCVCGCQTDYCRTCAMQHFGNAQAIDEIKSPKVCRRKDGSFYNDIILDTLFPNAAVFLPYEAEENIAPEKTVKDDDASPNKDSDTKDEGTEVALTIDTNGGNLENTGNITRKDNSRNKIITKVSIDKKMLAILQLRCSSAMSVRYYLIQAMNACVMDCMALINISKITSKNNGFTSTISELLGKCRALLTNTLRDGLWKQSLALTSVNGRAFGELRVSRSLAKKYSDEPDRLGRYSVFSQAFRRMHPMPPQNFRHASKLYELVLMGEYSQDAGGPYRESFDIYTAELQSNNMSLLLRTPNGTHNTGLNRDAWVFNPSATSTTELELLSFFGKILGIAIRSRGYLNLNLAPMMWKLISGEIASVDDLEGIDYGVVKNILESFRHIDKGEHAIDAETFSMTFFETFSTISTDGRQVTLCPNGDEIDVTFNNRNRWCDLVEQYRLHEFDTQVAAVRRGMATIIPLDMLSLFTWEGVERMVCGNAEVDVELLKRCTRYEGCSSNDPHVKFFWEVINEFNTEERQALIKFTWGRSRLPLTAEDFHEKFTITTFNHSPADQYYPVAHTCFFSLELPRYSSKKIMKKKLLYAIFNCLEIDGDETGPGAEAAALGWENDM